MDNRLIAAAYIKELESEYTATRKCLERIPDGLTEYQPHPKSMKMGYLVLLVAEIPNWIKYMVEEGEIDFATYRPFQPQNTAELVDHFENVFQAAKLALQSVTDEALTSTFRLKRDGEVVWEVPVLDGIGNTINHWVHHRGQLTVYMRLNDIPVPSVYGPSADDRGFN